LTEEKQVVTCEGCGCKWLVDIAKGRASVIARLLECPLCENVSEEIKT